MEKVELYSIKLLDENDETVQPNGAVIIRFPIMRTWKDMQALRIKPAEDIKYQAKLVDVDEEKYCEIKTDHFSVYCISDKYTTSEYIRVLQALLFCL